MFKLAPNPTFDATVKITVPGSDAPALLALTFRHKGREALQEWIASMAGRTDDQALDEVIADWRDVQGPDGGPQAYSTPALARLLNDYPASGLEIFNAYLAELSSSRAKN